MTENAFCVACKSQIISGATLCPVCKSYQSTWKHKLQYLAGVAGLVTVFIAVLTYTVASWPEVRKVFYWRDRVGITSFDSVNGYIVVSNSGDGEVFVSHLSLHSDTPRFSKTWCINTVVKGNSFSTKEIPHQGEWYTGPLSEEEWQHVLTVAPGECFQWNFFDEANPIYLDFQQFTGGQLRKLQLLGSINFISGHDQRRMSRDVQVYAVPVFNRAEECKAKLGFLPRASAR
ncbi:MAG TPA: hypothetical protein VEF34_06095 [Syntrophobacteraceae bacterium]|nr:hypothetical protein [Syntrophobacteraceae bacterium]